MPPSALLPPGPASRISRDSLHSRPARPPDPASPGEAGWPGPVQGPDGPFDERIPDAACLWSLFSDQAARHGLREPADRGLHSGCPRPAQSTWR